MYVVVDFIVGLIFIFICFIIIIIHYHTQKQKKIKIEPTIKLNCNMYIKYMYRALSKRLLIVSNIAGVEGSKCLAPYIVKYLLEGSRNYNQLQTVKLPAASTF